LSDAYFDTSALVKLLINERGTDQAWETWLDAAPPISARVTFAEVRAALAAGLRSGRLRRSDHEDAGQLLEVLWREVSPVEIDQVLVELAGDLAEQHALRGYDAVHLAAALTAGAEILVSSDAEQLRAAHAESLATLDPATRP
jgi:uncharacterized protein